MAEQKRNWPPAPWTWEEHELSEGYSCIVYDATGHSIGYEHLNRGGASLIAAAPELYEALERFSNLLRDETRLAGAQGRDLIMRVPGELFEVARIALDKARGER